MAPAKRQPRSALSARLSALHAETNLPQPYEVAEGLVVTPPGRKRSQAMSDAETRIYVYSALLQQAVSRTGEEAAGEDVLNGLSDEITKAREDYERAFFGDAYDAVTAYFDDDSLPTQFYGAFVEDIKAEFLPAAPADGKCVTCGRVDEETAGKEPEPST
jgi:hypothetical protein